MSTEVNKSSNKSFGIVFSIVFLLIAIYPILHDGNIRFWSIIVSIIFLILGLLNSKILSPLNYAWFKFGIFLGKFISPLVMGVIFFLVVTPTGLIMRILGKDILKLKYSNKKSYWLQKSNQKNTMKNQF